MAQKKLIAEELEGLNSLKEMAESYEEIAATQMQKIKDSVLKTRDYLAGISDVFVDLKASYQREVKDLLIRRKKGDKTLSPFLQKNPKLLMVYLSSNGRLYGAVTKKTFDLFIEDLKKNDPDKVDVVVIGRAGKELYESSSLHKEFDFFDIPDNSVGIEHIKSIMKKYLQYDRVHVYYGKFGNVVKQSAIETSITGEDIFENEVPSNVPREDKFIFEPVLQKIFHFFETQIMANLFSQTLLENQLARHASRVNAMEEALVHIQDESKRLIQQRTRIKHMLQNKKQLDSLAGLVMWDSN
ncbi:MAG: F0F1 ATP synthase subunit gamma [Patescibacteria group bacterium]